MDKYFEALEKSKNQVTLGVLGQVGFDETAEVLEKGKKAAMGEIREWNGIKYQKTPKGWVPVKKQEGASKGKLELPETGKELVYECKDESGPSLIKVRALNDGKYGFKKMVSGKWVGDGVGTAEQAQKKLSNYTLDKEKNTSPAENQKKILEDFSEKLEDWGFPVHGVSIKKNKTGYSLRVTAPVDQNWIPVSDTMENQEKKMKVALEAHKDVLDKLNIKYKIDPVPGGRGTLDLACYFRIK